MLGLSFTHPALCAEKSVCVPIHSLATMSGEERCGCSLCECPLPQFFEPFVIEQIAFLVMEWEWKQEAGPLWF